MVGRLRRLRHVLQIASSWHDMRCYEQDSELVYTFVNITGSDMDR